VTQKPKGSAAALAAVLGGAVTRERLHRAATREGRTDAELVRTLLAQAMPTIEDLARAYREAGGSLRLDPSFVRLAPRAARLLDPDLLRRERCVPVEIFEDLCILAVDASRATTAAEAVRAALSRDVLPVVADAEVIDRVLADLPSLPPAVRHGALPRRDSPVHARFRELVIEDAGAEALPLRQEGAP
jgi:Type II secretion system (T2SS), protein E, N-terminal domain